MRPIFRRFAQLILVLRWPALLALFLFTLIHAFKAAHLQIDPTVDMMFVKKSREYQEYQDYRKRYGSDQIILAAMSTSDIFTPENLELLSRVTRAVAEYPEVENVISLASVSDIRHRMFGVRTVPALEGVLEGDRDMEKVRARILNNELYVHNVISPDAKTANLIIFIKPEQGKKSGNLIEKLKTLFASEEKADTKFYMAGAPVEQYEFVKLIRRDQFTFVPMITLFLTLATYVFYRSIPCVILALATVFMTLAWTFGTISFVGDELNLVTSLLAPVIMIITVVNAIHYMNLFFDIRTKHPSLRKSVVLTVEQLGLPCLLTHFTTILGFLSLSLTNIPAIRSFGLYAAMGTFYSFVVSMIFTPVFLLVLPYRPKVKSQGGGVSPHFFNRLVVAFLEKLEHRWKWVILLSVVGAVFFSVKGIQRLEVDTNIVKQMKEDSPLAQATRYIDENITGVYTLGFVLRTRDGSTIVDRDKLEKLDAFKTFLEGMPEITNVNSITTLIKRIHAVRKEEDSFYVIPEKSSLDTYFKGIAAEDSPEVWSMVSRDLKEVRLQAQMKAVGTQEGAEVERRAREYMEKELAPYFDTLMTGNVVLLGRMAENLVRSQMTSFGFAFLAIFFVITLFFRSFMMGVLAAIPNLLPILMTYGLMGFLHVELSTSTAMISSIVLGLVVDSSIHFLHRFKLEFEKRGYYLQALHHTYRHTGQALVISTLILVVGFATSIFASFEPTIQFGVLTSLTILMALICTLLALPVWVVMIRPFGPQRLFRNRKKTLDPFH